jgi:hypothetical protein
MFIPWPLPPEHWSRPIVSPMQRIRVQRESTFGVYLLTRAAPPLVLKVFSACDGVSVQAAAATLGREEDPINRQQLHNACSEMARMLARILPKTRKPKRTSDKEEQAATDAVTMAVEMRNAGLDVDSVPLAVNSLSRFFRCGPLLLLASYLIVGSCRPHLGWQRKEAVGRSSAPNHRGA